MSNETVKLIEQLAQNEEQILASQAGKATKQGGVVLTDTECNHRAKYGAVSSGIDIYRSDAPDEPTESDLRFCDAIGVSSMASGMGAVAYSRASKSLGLRTQTGYPPNAEEIEKRPEAVISATEGASILGEIDSYSEGVQINADGSVVFPFHLQESPGHVNVIYTLKSDISNGNARFQCTIKYPLDTLLVRLSALNSNYEEISEVFLWDNSNMESISELNDYVSIPKNTAFVKLEAYSGGTTISNIDIVACEYPADNVGVAAVAIGVDTAALENYSFAGGDRSISHKRSSFTFGRRCESQQVNAIAMGEGLIATGENQAVFGQYNDTNAGLRFIVGVGKDEENRKNALEIWKDSGNAKFHGALTAASAFKASGVATFENTITAPTFYASTDGRIQAGSGVAANVKNTAAFGKGTTAHREGMLVCGQYNDPNLAAASTAMFVVGGGTADEPCNLFQVRTYGKQTKVNGSFSVNDKFVVDTNGKTNIIGGLSFTSIDDASATLVRNILTGATAPNNVTGSFTGQLYIHLQNAGLDGADVYMWVEAPYDSSAWYRIYKFVAGMEEPGDVIIPT